MPSFLRFLDILWKDAEPTPSLCFVRMSLLLSVEFSNLIMDLIPTLRSKEANSIKFWVVHLK